MLNQYRTLARSGNGWLRARLAEFAALAVGAAAFYSVLLVV